MAIPFEFKRGDTLVSANFQAPAFELLRAPLDELVFKGMAQHGVRLSDISRPNPGTSIDDHELRVTLYGGTIVLGIRLGRFEIHVLDIGSLIGDRLHVVTNDVLFAVQNAAPSVRLGSLGITVAMHGSIGGSDAISRLTRKWSGAPLERLGPMVASGAAFYFGPEEDRLMSVVAVDRSIHQEDWLFLKVGGTWDASKSSIKSLFLIWNQYFGLALNELDLMFPVVPSRT